MSSAPKCATLLDFRLENGLFTCYDFPVLDCDRHAVSFAVLPISAENANPEKS
jgi:hypothetical protein